MQIITDKNIHHNIKSYTKTSDKLLQLRRYYDLGAVSPSEYVQARTQVLREAKIVSKVSKK